MIENDDYIFIYINSISAIIIPINVFKNTEEKENFKSLLN
ncbi:YcxB family protein [Clostridium neonatale]